MSDDMRRVGDLFGEVLASLPNKPQKLNKALTVKPSDMKLLDVAERLQEAPDGIERAYMARELVQCTLPHSNPGDVPVWLRRNGRQALAIQPGWDLKEGKSLGYPYGTIPRLLLFWLVTEATVTKSRRVYLGDPKGGNNSLGGFMRQLGLNPDNGTGPRSDRQRLRDAIRSLFGARISFQEFTEFDTSVRERRMNMDVAAKSELWWSTKPGHVDQGALWQSWVELGEQFYEAVTAYPIPVDMRILRALKSSALALDLYAWVCHKAYSVNKSGRPSFVPWQSLMTQLGTDYSNPDEFARKARASLRKVRMLWRKTDLGFPGLLLDLDKRGGVSIHPGSLLSVPETVPALK